MEKYKETILMFIPFLLLIFILKKVKVNAPKKARNKNEYNAEGNCFEFFFQ